MIESIVLFVIVRRYAPHYLFNDQSVKRYGTTPIGGSKVL